MAKEYTITFVNGVAENVELPVGTYTYQSNTIPGYDDGTVNSFKIEPSSTEINLTITANGVLNISVKDDLDAPITSGSLQLSDSTGDTVYGQSVSITEGEATFEHVPYDSNGIDFYVKQNESDELHDPIEDPQAVSMTETPQDEAILNARKIITLDLKVADMYYEGITELNGNIVVEG